MFKVVYDFSQFKRLNNSLRRVVESVLERRDVQSHIAEAVRRDIVTQTRRGVSVVTGQKFKSLSEGWIELRKKIILATSVPEWVSAKKSNLSLSGQLLDSLDYKLFGVGLGFEARFYFRGTHSPYQYRGKSGKMVTVGKRIANEKLADYVEVERPFIGVRQKLQDDLIRYIIDTLRVSITKLEREGV